MSEGQMGESCKSFTPPTPLNNRGEVLDFIRPLNDGRTMHNDQNGLVLMFGSSKQHMAQETKPDFDRNMIEREVA